MSIKHNEYKKNSEKTESDWTVYFLFPIEDGVNTVESNNEAHKSNK